MDEHRQLLTELEVMVEEHGDEMGEGQDIMSEDAASTISIEWDDWSSATYGQSMKDEVLADALRKANTDLLWKFEIPWMKQVSRARIKERKKIEIEKWKIDSKRIRKGSRLRAREMRRWEWDARRKVEKARILGEDLWAWDLESRRMEEESRRMEEESRRMDEESIMMEREWMIAEGLLEEEQELMGEPQDEELVFGEKWMEKKEELRRMELESRRMELEWERKEELRTLEAFTGRDQDRWSRLMTVDLPTTEMEESIPINENWMTISQESMNEDLKVPEGSNENKESIMNEDFRKIVDEIMKEELIVKAKDKWHDEGSMGVFSDEVMGYEEAMDYPPSIVNELRGWRPATPTVCGRDACDEEAMDYELSIMDEISGLYPTSPFSKKQKTFHYDPLDQPKQEIRIVRLHPRRWLTDPDISCDLITLDLRTAPEYEALSYEWGCPPSASNQYTIQINSRLMVITRNLWLALYELRDRRKPRTLWIDALCINQLDVLERSCQVSRMGDIYSQAITVVAWIGQQDYESKYGRAFLAELNSIPADKYCPPRRACPRRRHRDKWQALRSLCCRSYWDRLWIIQEVVLASDLHVQFGSLSFQWEELSNVFHYLRHNLTGSCSPDVKLDLVKSVPFRLEMRRKKRQMAILEKNNDDLIPLLDVVDLFKGSKCSDERDKIFGLRSLSPSCCRDAVQTDYSMTNEDVINILIAHNEVEHS